MTSMILTILSDLWELPRIALISGQCKVHHPRIRRLLELDFAWIFSTLEFPLLFPPPPELSTFLHFSLDQLIVLRARKSIPPGANPKAIAHTDKSFSPPQSYQINCPILENDHNGSQQYVESTFCLNKSNVKKFPRKLI